jgi:hypothetical protein
MYCRRALNLKEQKRAMTNDEPPPPTVTELQPEIVALCPGEHVEFKASTSPQTERVKWTAAANGGAPEEVPAEGDDGNTLTIRDQGQTQVVVTASLTNTFSATAIWKVVGLRIDLTPEPDNRRYVITDEPRMPAITATAVGIGGAASELEWKIRVAFGAEITTTDVFGSVVSGLFKKALRIDHALSPQFHSQFNFD